MKNRPTKRFTDLVEREFGERELGARVAPVPRFAQQRAHAGRSPFAELVTRISRLHCDQRGTISILSVFCLLMFTMLLVMIINVARHVDDKLQMQNAADAAGYSGGVVLARGMNAVAFTNHLLCDVFAMTAFLREGSQRNAEKMTPEILDAWAEIGPVFSQAEFEKFQQLGEAITDKVPKERELVQAFGEMTAASAELTRPVFEYMLAEEVIPRFQQTVIRTIPELAQQAANEISVRHGMGRRDIETSLDSGTQSTSGSSQIGPSADRGLQRGVLWRANALPVGYPDENDPLRRTLPIVDPTPPAAPSENSQQDSWQPLTDFEMVPNPEHYLSTALEQRRRLSEFFLDRWNADRLVVFNRDAKMLAFYPLWRIATCGQLEKLLTVDYPLTNLPMQIRTTEVGADVEQTLKSYEKTLGLRRLVRPELEQLLQAMQHIDLQQHIEDNDQFLAVVYRRPLREMAPGLFANPLARRSDTLTFAQVRLFLPRPRQRPYSPGEGDGNAPRDPCDERWRLENWPTHWDLLNQNWMVKLVPARMPNLPVILQSNPAGSAASQNLPAEFRLPDLGAADIRDLSKVNMH